MGEGKNNEVLTIREIIGVKDRRGFEEVIGYMRDRYPRSIRRTARGRAIMLLRNAAADCRGWVVSSIFETLEKEKDIQGAPNTWFRRNLYEVLLNMLDREIDKKVESMIEDEPCLVKCPVVHLLYPLYFKYAANIKRRSTSSNCSAECFKKFIEG